MISPEDFEKVETELRALLDGGTSLGDALRLLHGERQVGLFFLWPVVMKIQKVDKKEAMRIVVHETASWRADENAR